MEMDYRALSRSCVCICKEVDTEVVFFGFPYTLEDIYVEPCSILAPNQIENQHWYAAVAEEPKLLLLLRPLQTGWNTRVEQKYAHFFYFYVFTYPGPSQDNGLRVHQPLILAPPIPDRQETHGGKWPLTFPLLASSSSLVPQGTCYMGLDIKPSCTWRI